jgi:hypothetical protein
MRSTDTIRADMTRAMTDRDPTALEDAVLASFEAQLPAELGELLADALLLPWHFRHEEIAVALKRMGDPRTATALAKAALMRPTYLSFDEYRRLARRCTAALAAIGNAHAKDHLVELARGDDRVCAGFAQRHLDAWRGD